jgi:hypothetical protein
MQSVTVWGGQFTKIRLSCQVRLALSTENQAHVRLELLKENQAHARHKLSTENQAHFRLELSTENQAHHVRLELLKENQAHARHKLSTENQAHVRLDFQQRIMLMLDLSFQQFNPRSKLGNSDMPSWKLRWFRQCGLNLKMGTKKLFDFCEQVPDD